MADESQSEPAPGERIPPHRRRPPRWHVLSPVLIIIAMVINLVIVDGWVRWIPAIILVVALVQLGTTLVRRWRRAPEGARKL